MSRSLRLSLTLMLIIMGGCFPPDDGIDPPMDRINFPVGLALSSGGDRLYVANSDFDLQYNAGTVQVFDAARIREQLPVHCDAAHPCQAGTCADEEGSPRFGLCIVAGSPCPGGAQSEQSPAERFLSPGFCRRRILTGSKPLLLDSARISPFVADLTYAVRVDSAGRERARLLMPVRGDATIHWADVEHDAAGSGPVLSCGQDNELRACDDDHRRGDGPDERSLEGGNLPPEPFALAVSEDGGEFLVTHQTQGKVSLFRNGADGPELLSTLGGLPRNPMGVAAVPKPALAAIRGLNYHQGYLVTFITSNPSVELLRSHVTADDALVQRAGRAGISVADATNVRGIAIDDAERRTCETRCDCPANAEPTDAKSCETCLEDCARIPLAVFAANRTPSSLLVGRTSPALNETRTDDLPNFSDLEPLRGGASRVWIGSVIDEQGQKALRVFVVAFESRLLYVYDPAARAVETRISTGRGPHGLAVDSDRGLLYLAHFMDSYIGVVDLDKRHSTFGQFLLNVGEPSSPRSAK